MGVRDTSIEAYREALASGWINECEFRVIEASHDHYRPQGWTTRELMRIIGQEIGNLSWDRLQDYQKTVDPLKKRGVLEELEKRKCEITGHKAYPVRLTYNPVGPKPKHKTTEKEALRKRIKELEEENARLKAAQVKGQLALF